MENATKIFGWILLIAGVAIIGWTLMSSYNILIAQADLPELFKMGEEAKTPLAQKGSAEALLQEQMGKMISEQIKGIVPVDTVPKMLNLGVWAMLAGLLIFGGAQIAGLGIKLIKK